MAGATNTAVSSQGRLVGQSNYGFLWKSIEQFGTMWCDARRWWWVLCIELFPHLVSCLPLDIFFLLSKICLLIMQCCHSAFEIFLIITHNWYILLKLFLSHWNPGLVYFFLSLFSCSVFQHDWCNCVWANIQQWPEDAPSRIWHVEGEEMSA